MASQFGRHLVQSTKLKENVNTLKFRKMDPMSIKLSEDSVNKLLEAHQRMIATKFKDISIVKLSYLDKVNCIILH